MVQHTKGESLVSYIWRKDIESFTEIFEWTSLKQKAKAIPLIHNLTFQRMGGEKIGNSTTGLADKNEAKELKLQYVSTGRKWEWHYRGESLKCYQPGHPVS